MNKIITKLTLSNDPNIHTRTVLFGDSAEVIDYKNKKMFVVSTDCSLQVNFEDNTNLVINAVKGYAYDGATIPFGIGKGNMKLLIPALFHDIMCENKEIVDYDRKLSSDIFYNALLECKVNPRTAKLMYKIVDTYQIPIWFVAKIIYRIKKWIKRS